MDQRFTVALFSAGGEKSLIHDGFLARGLRKISLRDWATRAGSGIYVLVVSNGHVQAQVKITLAGGRIGSFSRVAISGTGRLAKEAAEATDSLTFTKNGFITKKIPLPSLATQNLGDIPMSPLPSGIAVGVPAYDMHDTFILESAPRNGLDNAVAMVLKAMIMIESTFRVNAISMWDTQLPCGTHSYGLMQVTPGCVQGYATLNSGNPTASISGGLNGVPAQLTYFNDADRVSGNTTVRENGILINLVSNPSNPLYPTSAFNPAYSIDYGAKALSQVHSEMKSRFGGCTQVNYIHMALAGYNQGSLTVTGCNAFSANGRVYVDKVIAQYRSWCQSAGIPVVY
jgi:hypothetical protein